MRAVEELVRRNLEKHAPDELSPKPDPYDLRAPQGCSLLFPSCHRSQGQVNVVKVLVSVYALTLCFGLSGKHHTFGGRAFHVLLEKFQV